jgi:small subunit ribosomal protein S17
MNKMAKKEKQEESKSGEKQEKKSDSCKDPKCPFHGKIKTRGRVFKGEVKKIVGKRAIVEFERLVYIKKYERYLKKKTRLHAHVPDCLQLSTGNIVMAAECRPLSKMIHFVIIKKISKD